ncbi:MAG: polyprenyl synthetase family protein, partial [Geodermatophilaceae bacterium]
QLGKIAGTDLREGIRTLPMLHALAGTDPAESRLRELLDQDLSDDARHGEALQLLRRSPAMVRARQTLTDYADRARASLEVVPAGAARDALIMLCDYVLERTG